MAIPVNQAIQQAARHGLNLHNTSGLGGTKTGLNRARQLMAGTVDIKTIRTMRNWFARHYYASYPYYKKYIANGTHVRAAVAWLIWGGNPAYEWIKSTKIQALLNQYYPDKDNGLPNLY